MAVLITEESTREVVAKLPYNVAAEEEPGESPRLVLSVPAGEALVDKDGSCQVSGIFEYVSFERLPATDSFAIATVYFSGDDEVHAHSVRILDPAGKVIASPAAQRLPFPSAAMTVVTDSFPNLRFPSAGSYAVVVSLDGSTLARYPLAVRKE